MFTRKLEKFYGEMKERGYKIRLDESSVDLYQNKNHHIVTKDDFFHFSISEKLIFEAPMDYLIGLVEKGFERLEQQITQ